MIVKHQKRGLAEQLRRALIVDTGRTVTDVAKQIGIGRSALSNTLNGNAELSIELALRLENIFGMNARDLLIEQMDEKIAVARKQQNG